MDKDRVVGRSATGEGGRQRRLSAGRTGDAKTQAEGRAEKTAGKVQNAVG